MIHVEPVVGLTPFERPDAPLVAALSRAGALGVLDVGSDPRTAEQALATLTRRVPRGFGVRIPAEVELTALPPEARVVVLPAGTSLYRWRDRTVLVEVTSLDEARAALAHGAHGLIAKGNEAGGRVGDEPAFILLQRLLREIGAPVWAMGGIGLHTAAACIAAGARGVVLDAQLSLLKESSLPEEVKRIVAAMDGSETRIVRGRRLYAAPSGGPAAFPAGQDAAFAKPLADRFQGVEALVRALRSAIVGHVRQARALRPLGPGSPLAVDTGTRFPIAQGPMTRVSDRAGFADAVSRAGGLPFLALSLMRGKEARELLEETAALHHGTGRPWGVGILGFVPPEIRDEQLALVLDVRPDVVLVAGGRPAHARPLEDAGIKTYLHVPSPGLLDLFLKDGMRRFVFEGRECGGHVGPRSSLVLWESAIERLLQFDGLREVSVLFAGGIHDARSAAMVSAMAAPLAARGAKVGVLMGTAYLFTEEAVATGAILPSFQEEAMRCDRTVLLETAPGHATRCADTSYTRAFEEERARLEQEGKSRQDIWEALETMNLGRLRIASKGLSRDRDALVLVDEDRQKKDGMFMIGQVAALRSARSTIDELHRDVSEGSLAHLEQVDLLPPRAKKGTDIAIIGMACIFPDAPNLSAFWKNVVLGANAVKEVPKQRWNPELYFDPKGTGEKTPSKWGGFLPEVTFDPATFGIPPRSLAAIDPVQLLSLEVSRRALEDAGYAEREFDRERTSVIFGAEAGTELAGAYGFRASYPQMVGALPEALDGHLPKLTEDSFAGVLANVIAGRIANRLDLGGVNYTVDAACASSLAAVDLACKELASGTSDMVIGGGADLHNSINDYLMFASVHALSPTGQCRTFDSSADGIVLGEGVAAVVLKRLDDARRDGDRVYAVIKGVGGSSDGKSLGLTAPRKEGQARALERAYEAAGISPADVGLIEAHGTGTVVGDKTELATLTDFFSSAGALPGGTTLGSVKSNIGHTKCAAGLAGLIKAALSVHHGVLPPTLNLERPNPFYDGQSSPFAFRRAAGPWADESRIAGVSAFGFGGTNFHVVLASDEPPHGAALEEWPAELFLFRGASGAVAEAAMGQLAQVVEQHGAHLRLRDLARTVAESGNPGDPVQVALVATSVDDLSERLRAASRKGAGGKPVPHVFFARERHDAHEVAFLFPGQGSQKPGMLSDLFVSFPELREIARAGKKWLAPLFPPAAFGDAEKAAQKAAITDTRTAQPTLGMAGTAVTRLLARFGVYPAMTGGHSYGELVALSVAGAIPEERLLEISEARAGAILGAAKEAPGTMAAVGASAKAVREALAEVEGITLANHNAPDQTVIAGSEEAVGSALERLASRGISGRRIPVACAFHSPIVAGASNTFARTLASVPLYRPSLAVYCNSTAERYPSDPDAIRWQLARQLALPVRFADEIEAMYADGARVFVEAGPGGVLSDLVGRILKGRPHVAIRIDRPGEHGLEGFLAALGELAAAGIEVDATTLFRGRDARSIDLANVGRLAPPDTAWIVNGWAARPVRGELPDFAMRLPAAPLGDAARQPVASSDRDTAIVEYLRSMREIADGQRQVMLRYLGEAAVEPERAAEPRVPASTTRAVAVARPEPAPAPAPASEDTAITPLDALVAAVSERTGYPPEMLAPDLDLEADLGIDSIKRIEILGKMRDRLGLGTMTDQARSDALEELARFKTLRDIANWLEARIPADKKAPAPAPPISGGANPPTDAASRPTLPSPAWTGSTDTELGRYVPEVCTVPQAKPNGVRVEGHTFAVVPDRLGVAQKLAEILVARGAHVEIARSGAEVGTADGVVYLASLAPGAGDSSRPGDSLRPPLAEDDAEAAPESGVSEKGMGALFEVAKAAVRAKSKWLVAVTGLGGGFGMASRGASAAGGASGLLKSVAKEHPELRVRAIDLDPTEEPTELASHLYAELLADDALVEVGYARGVRQAVRIVERPPPEDEPSLTLDRDAVILVTGGARGITAEVSIALARRFGCKLELVGRTPLGAGEDEELGRAKDLPQVRKLLLERTNGGGVVTPASIERAARAVLAEREIRVNLARIGQVGGRATYASLDVRDETSFGAYVDALYDRHGRIDGVIHGAGVIEDKLLSDKTRESFDRVFETKVFPAHTLLRKLRGSIRFVAFFSSVSGAFGNRGQSDYAAANDALDKLAHEMQRTLGTRVLSVNWGPWRGVGMVSPELEREYTRRGVQLIAPEQGAERFVDELCRGRETQVILATPKAVGFE